MKPLNLHPDDMPDPNSPALFPWEADAETESQTPPQYSSTPFAILQRCAIEEMLDLRLEKTVDLLEGWQQFFAREKQTNLKALTDPRTTKAARSNKRRALERDEAMHRARQIAGVLLQDMYYELRGLVADQLERELKSKGAKEAALLIRNMNPNPVNDGEDAE